MSRSPTTCAHGLGRKGTPCHELATVRVLYDPPPRGLVLCERHRQLPQYRDRPFEVYVQPDGSLNDVAARAREADQFVCDFHEWWTHTITVRPPESLIARARKYVESKP